MKTVFRLMFGSLLAYVLFLGAVVWFVAARAWPWLVSFLQANGVRGL